MSLIDDMNKAVALLKQHDAIPSRIEITRKQFERLKTEFYWPSSDKPPSSIFGIQIVVKE